MWMRWYLDNFATVKEAVDASRNLPDRIRTAMDHHGTNWEFRIAMEDANGDSAILEFTLGSFDSPGRESEAN